MVEYFHRTSRSCVMLSLPSVVVERNRSRAFALRLGVVRPVVRASRFRWYLGPTIGTDSWVQSLFSS